MSDSAPHRVPGAAFRGSRCGVFFGSRATARPRPPFLGVWVAGVIALGMGAARLEADSMEAWWPIDNAQLQEKAPRLDPDAPAEVLDCHILIDDRDRPASKTTRTYYRYKVYDPSKATSITRISARSASLDGEIYFDVDVKARLILPDGTTRLFGRESIQERDLSRNGSAKTWLTRVFGPSGYALKEKFLATEGIVPGAILEVQTVARQERPGSFTSIVLQLENVPIRHLRLELQAADPSRLQPITTLLNLGTLKIDREADLKRKSVVITGENLPGYVDEPFVGPLIDRALTFVLDYRAVNSSLPTHYPFEHKRFDPKDGIWTEWGTIAYIVEQDVTRPSRAIGALTGKVTSGAATEREKAVRIHNYVRERWAAFKKTPHQAVFNPWLALPMAEDVAEFEKHHDTFIPEASFVHLALAMYRAAGLEAQYILLANNRTISFNPRMGFEEFMPNMCARVRVGGDWCFSMPNASPPLPFGALPWVNRGSRGLIAEDGKAEFFDIPETPYSDSEVKNTGVFTLDADGSLEGTCRRVLTGIMAANLRGKYGEGERAALSHHVADALKDELKADSVEVSAVQGFDDPDSPIVIDYQAHFPDYAEMAKRRMSFRVNPFRGQNTSPFSSETRHYNINFPYRWTDSDQFRVKFPPGYSLEAPSSPPSQPGKAFSYSIAISGSSKAGEIRVDRTYVSNAEIVPASSYPALKSWFDMMARSDAHELVLVRPEAPPVAGVK